MGRVFDERKGELLRICVRLDAEDVPLQSPPRNFDEALAVTVPPTIRMITYRYLGPPREMEPEEPGAEPPATPLPAFEIELPAPPVEAEKAPAKPIEGVWKIRYVERDGAIQKSSLSDRMPSAVRFDGDGTFRVHEVVVSKALSSLVKRGRYQVFPGSSPARIDLSMSVTPSPDLPAPPAVEAQHGIYRIDGETMTLCVYSPNATQAMPHVAAYAPGPYQQYEAYRPKGFETSSGDGRLLMVLERGSEKDFEMEAQESANELIGTWRGVEMQPGSEIGGGITPASIELVVVPGRMFFGGVGQQISDYTIRTDVSPHEIDLHGLKPKTDLKGIYERKGELLHLCLASSELRRRPESFEDGRILVAAENPLVSLMTFRYVGPPHEVDFEGLSEPEKEAPVMPPPVSEVEVPNVRPVAPAACAGERSDSASASARAGAGGRPRRQVRPEP